MPIVGSGRSHESSSARGRSHSSRSSSSHGSGHTSGRSKKKRHESVDAENVIMLGPPGAGKRTLLSNWFAQRRIVCRSGRCLPSGFGVRVRPLASGAKLFTLLGMDTATSLARSAKRFCGNAKVMLYVIDATDEGQIQRARLELQDLTKFDVFKFCRIVVAGNQREGCGRVFNRYELMGRSMLNVDSLQQQVSVFDVNVLSGEGLSELYHAITKQHVATSSRATRNQPVCGNRESRHASRDRHGNGVGPPQSPSIDERCQSVDSYRGSSQDSHVS